MLTHPRAWWLSEMHRTHSSTRKVYVGVLILQIAFKVSSFLTIAKEIIILFMRVVK